MKPFWMLCARSLVVPLATATTLLTSCGGSASSSDELTCGPGTHASGNQCVANATPSGGVGGEPASTGGDTSPGGAPSGGAPSAGAPGAGGTGGTSPPPGGTGGITAATGGTSGTLATGGTSSVGGTAGSTGGNSATGGTSGAVGVLGDPCDAPGELACAGNFQKVTVICGGSGTWEVNETCGASEFCDSAPGLNQGLCAAPHPDCLGRVPGEVICGSAVSFQCGPDTLTKLEMDECDPSCGEACLAEPCPTDPDMDILNCDPTCGAVDERCPEIPEDCDPDAYEIEVIRASTLARDTVIRVPAGGLQCPCGDYVLFAVIGLEPYWKAESASPWEFVVPEETLPCGNITGVKCYEYVEGEYHTAHIRAPGSNAPAANLIVTFGTGAC